MPDTYPPRAQVDQVDWYARAVTTDETHFDTPAEAIADATEHDAPELRGRRFITKYEERAHLHRLHPVRLWRLVLGLGLLAFGIVNIFIPGPGGSVIILASLLVLAGESRLLARCFDWGEVRFAPQVDWALQHKLLTVLIISGSAFIFTVTAHRLLRGSWLPW